MHIVCTYAQSPFNTRTYVPVTPCTCSKQNMHMPVSTKKPAMTKAVWRSAAWQHKVRNTCKLRVASFASLGNVLQATNCTTAMQSERHLECFLVLCSTPALPPLAYLAAELLEGPPAIEAALLVLAAPGTTVGSLCRAPLLSWTSQSRGFGRNATTDANRTSAIRP